MQLTIRLLKWCDRKAITLVPVHLPGVHNIQADSLSRVGQTLTTEWTMAMERLRPVFAKWGETQVDLFATFANRLLIKFVLPYPDPRAEWTDAMSVPWDNGRGLLYAFPPFKMVPQVLSTCLRHSPTDDSSSSHHRIRTPGQSGQMPCPCLWATVGASCTRSRHSRWSLKYCRRSLSHQEWRWFGSLNCNWQHRGFQSRWIASKKIRSRCTSRVKTCWHKTFGRETGWPRLVTSDHQIYTGGNSAGHPEGEEPFQGSCQHDVKVPSGIFTASVRIPLVKIRGVL